MGTIYLVRHGQASFGAVDYDQLSPRGEEQARLLGSWLSDCGRSIPAIATGSHRRHLQSAAACSTACPAPPPKEWTRDRGFDEFDHHEILARHRPEFAVPGGLDAFLAASDQPRRAFQQLFAAAVARWTGGGHDADYSESFSAFRNRAVAALQRLTSKPGAAAETWVFTSGGAISAIVQELLAIPDGRIFELNWTLINTGVTKILYRPGRVSLGYLNSQAHLERLQQPELITYR